MHETVSDILLERARESDRLGQMVLMSCLAHGLLIAAIAIMPAGWRMSSKSADVIPMTITLSSGGGPDTGGMTPISGRPVQEVAAETKPTPIAPPVSKPPEMVAPEPKATPLSKTPPKKIEKPVDKSSTRKPTTGPQVKAGDARADTGGAPIPFGGLTRPAGASSAGAAVTTDYANFCCPSYLNQMVDLIKRNWNQNQGASGEVGVKFTIHRDGTISDVELEKPSNISLLDLESQRALGKTRTLPPLPREFSENTLTVHLIFDYHR
jgi:periplasmic protein TonB